MSVSKSSPRSTQPTSWRARGTRALVLLSLAASALTGVATTTSAQAAGPEMGPATALSVYGANAAGRMQPPPELTDFRNVVADVSAGSDHALAVTDLGTLFVAREARSHRPLRIPLPGGRPLSTPGRGGAARS